MNDCFAMYKLPHETTYTVMRQYDGGAKILSSYKDLNNKSGFLFSPFKMTEKYPLLLIKPDKVETYGLEDIDASELSTFMCRDIETERQHYENDFINFHNHLENGEFKKLVLARKSIETACSQISPETIFKRACNMYPNEFVALVSTPYSGMWLTATPETLIEGNGNEWHTVALAGTMRLNTKRSTDINSSSVDLIWDKKNIQEQQYVAKYIKECLTKFTSDIEETLPRTVVAGMLIHIVTHFRFKMNSNTSIGQLIDELHPTPAVCGLPKDKAYDFIINNEGCNRAYYSGFSGLLNYNDSTKLFVTLRCMQIKGMRYELYAGGGLLCESDVEKEWLETEAKMETMKRCLAIKKI